MADRRSFIKNTSLLTGAALLPFDLIASCRTTVPASDRIRVAAIGVNGMGFADTQSMMKNSEVDIVALCDVDENVLSQRVTDLAKANVKVATYTDYRKILDDKSIDAVIIGTPDHWHCKIMVDASQAGKHVYCEKPAGHSIAECDVMIAAQKKFGNVVQIGQWQRSQKHFQDAVDFVQSGKLGKVRLVKAWAYMGWMKPIPIKPDGPAPQGVHYDKWLGMAENRAFNPNRFHFNFRWFYDYAGGLMTDWGVHLIDYAMMGMGASHQYPLSIAAIGGKTGYPDDAEEWPDTMSALYDFGTFNMVWEQAIGISGGSYNRDHGIAFIGNNGTLVLDRGGWEVLPEMDGKNPRMDAVERQHSADNGLDLHTKNFVEVIKSKRLTDLKAPIQDAAMVAINCCMGNIALLTKKTIHWDKDAGRFTDPEANKYLQAPYHNGISFPTV